MPLTATNTYGLTCCDTFQEWRELGYEMRGERWLWRCAVCGEVLRIDPYHPPAEQEQG